MEFITQNTIIILCGLYTLSFFATRLGKLGFYKKVTNYTKFYNEKNSVEERNSGYKEMVDNFYTIVTDFYMWGWGNSFHFAPRLTNETFHESILRAEYYISSRLGLTNNMKVLDIGCGVGGPMRNIHRFSGARINGVTLNKYQVDTGNRINERIRNKW